jgi:large subunit ribosomal protein L31
MKQKIHPTWYPNCKVTCSCGASFTTGSTKPDIHVEICSQCHPFYTGEMKYIDTLGRVEKFQAKQQAAATKTYVKKKVKKMLRKKLEDKADKERPKTLREMIQKERAKLKVKKAI